MYKKKVEYYIQKNPSTHIFQITKINKYYNYKYDKWFDSHIFAKELQRTGLNCKCYAWSFNKF